MFRKRIQGDKQGEEKCAKTPRVKNAGKCGKNALKRRENALNSAPKPKKEGNFPPKNRKKFLQNSHENYHILGNFLCCIKPEHPQNMNF